VDVLTLYDPFTIVALMQIEDMGFCRKGEGGAFVEGTALHFDGGVLPYNTHGGMLSHAYVLGIAHVVETVRQVRGEAAAQGAVARCRRCGEGGFAWTRMSGRGRLFSWVVVRRAFLPAFARKVPFVAALVALDEEPAVRLATNLVDCVPEALDFDMPLRAVFRPL